MPLHFTKAVSRIIFAIGVMNFDYWGFSSRADAEDVKPPDTGVIKSIVPAALAQLGVQFNATYIGEFLVNVSGGAKRGAVYDNAERLARIRRRAGFSALVRESSREYWLI
jgi:hypothetical protein